MDQNDLAASASVSRGVVIDFEKERRTPGKNNLTAIRVALESAGVIFIDDERGEGVVKLRTPSVDIVESEVIQYPEFLEGDGGPGSGG